ncbi:hypothetical protein CLOM_g1646 [Closterium sp. NIES-68]|nr:hypothetical protein CLOM_g1646 [Closterium sp. NIES-68]
MASLICALYAASGVAAASSSSGALTLLPNNAYGAKCLDGSPPGYYFRPGVGEGRLKWHIYLPGGGWCIGESDCEARSKDYLGRSSAWASSVTGNSGGHVPLTDGILSTDSGTNPSFYKWNTVIIAYCDGGGYTGTRGKVVTKSGKTLYLDGRNIVQAVLDDLKANRGMRSASEVLLSGQSAGGQAVVMLCDKVAESVPSARTKCIADSGFFLDSKAIDGGSSFRDSFEKFAAFHQIQVPNCKSGAKASQWFCYFPQYALGRVSTPIFIYQSMLDNTAAVLGNQMSADNPKGTKCLEGILGAKNITQVVKDWSWAKHPLKISACNKAEQDSMLTVASTLYMRLKKLARKRRSMGVFLAKSYTHSVVAKSFWRTVRAGGVDLPSAISDWHSTGRGTFLYG